MLVKYKPGHPLREAAANSNKGLGEGTTSKTCVKVWFEGSAAGDMTLEGAPRADQLSKVDNDVPKAIADEDPSHTEETVGQKLNVAQQYWQSIA